MDFQETLRSIAFPLVRMVGFCANALLFGTPVILLLVIRPAFRAAGPERWTKGRRRVAVRLEGLVQAALVGSATATTLAIVLQSTLVSELTGSDVTVSSFASVLKTSFGRWQGIRLVLLMGMALFLVSRVAEWSHAERGDPSGAPRAFWWAMWCALGTAMLASTSFSGHAAVASPRAVALVNDVVHLAAGSVWFAGIVLLAIVLPDGWSGRPQLERLTLVFPTIDRFARVALISIGIVAATGTLNSFLNVAEFNDLVDSGYGRSLLLKLAVFAVIVALGAINHYVLRRRLERAVERSEPSESARTLKKTIAAELLAALVIMGLTGVLVGESKTRQPQSESLSFSVRD